MESSNYTGGNTAGTGDGAGSTTGSNGSGGMGGSSAGGAAGQDTGLSDKANAAIGTAKERLGDMGATVRDRAGSAKDSLVGALDAGAEKLRQRGADGSLAGAGSLGGTAVISDDRMGQVTTKVAGGMEATADWLRDADLDSMKASVEKQVKDHPGRTLLIAVGLGYLLGKALKK